MYFIKIANHSKGIIIACLVIITGTLSYSKTMQEQGQISLSIGKTQSKREISRFRNITEGQIVREGDIIKTHSDGFIEIILFNNKRFRLYNNTLVLIEKITTTNINIFLYNGVISINEELAGDFVYEIKSKFFSILSSDIQTGNENKQNIIYKQTGLYIEYIAKLAKITLRKGNIKILQNTPNQNEENKKSLSLVAPASITFTKNLPLTKAKIDYEEDNISEYSEQIDNSFKKEPSIEEYNPEYETEITGEDIFYKSKRKTKNRKAIIKKYRKRKQIYYNIDIGAFNWIDNEFYLSMGFYPEFHIDTFTLRLRLLLFVSYTDPGDIDKYYNIEEWYFKELPDYFNKIDIIEYINKDKTFYIRLSELPRKTRGYGLTVKDYTNTILIPKQRLMAFDFGLNFPVIDIEGFSSDITQFNIMSFRIASRPFIEEENKDKYSAYYGIAINFSMDLEPDSITTNPSIFLGSIDITIPILRDINSDYQLSLYTEVAMQGYEFNNQTTANKYGEEANQLKFTDNFGLTIGINGLLFNRFIYKFQYNYLQKGFIPQYIDFFYEIEQENKMEILLTDNKDDAHGFLIGLGASFPEYIEIYTEFYYETGDIENLIKTKNKFKLEIKSSPKLSPIFSGRLIYVTKNISSIEHFFIDILDNSFLHFQAKAAATKWLDIEAGYKHFAEKEGNSFKFKNFVYINFLFIL